MGLVDTINRILKKRPRLRQQVTTMPEARKKLEEFVEEYNQKYSGLANAAKGVDKVNRILGPAEAGLRYLSPLGTIGFGIYSAAKLLHYALIKLPYAAYYAAKTRDIKGTLGMTLGEIAKYVTPFGTTADVLPLYRKTVENYVERKAADRLEDYLAKKGIKEYAERVKIPEELVRDHNAAVSGETLYMDVPSQGYDLNITPMGDGYHQVYLTRKPGIHPNVHTRLRTKLPKLTKGLRLHKRGLFKRVA